MTDIQYDDGEEVHTIKTLKIDGKTGDLTLVLEKHSYAIQLDHNFGNMKIVSAHGKQY